MSEIIAFCGIRCDKCDALIATRENDDSKRQDVAGTWSKQFNARIQPEQINCMGCRSEQGPIFFYCDMCEIRKCGEEKNVRNCAHCDDYVCDKLEQFFKMSPENREILEGIRRRL